MNKYSDQPELSFENLSLFCLFIFDGHYLVGFSDPDRPVFVFKRVFANGSIVHLSIAWRLF